MKFKKSLIVIFCFVGIVVLSFFIVANIAAIPTRGSKISTYPSPKKALLVIDVQNDAIKNNFKNIDSMIESINKAINKAKVDNMEIIYIKTEYPCYGCKILKVGIPYGKDTYGAEFDNRIQIVSNNIFSKWKGDAFSNNDLNQFLIDNQVDELYLTGIDGLQCVYYTMQGAVNRGYKVYGIRDAIDVLSPKNINDVENAYKKFNVNMISINDF